MPMPVSITCTMSIVRSLFGISLILISPPLLLNLTAFWIKLNKISEKSFYSILSENGNEVFNLMSNLISFSYIWILKGAATSRTSYTKLCRSIYSCVISNCFDCTYSWESCDLILNSRIFPEDQITCKLWSCSFLSVGRLGWSRSTSDIVRMALSGVNYSWLIVLTISCWYLNSLLRVSVRTTSLIFFMTSMRQSCPLNFLLDTCISSNYSLLLPFP